MAKAWERPGWRGRGDAEAASGGPCHGSTASLGQQLPPVLPAEPKGLRFSLSRRRELSLQPDSEYPLPLYLTCLSSQLNCILTGTNPEESHYKFFTAIKSLQINRKERILRDGVKAKAYRSLLATLRYAALSLKKEGE